MTRAATLIWLAFALFALADVARAAFPGQNGQIAFQSFRDNSFRSDIHVINPDGRGQLNLTNFPNAHETTPAWSADGTKLALTSNRTGTDDIFRMAADGTGLTQLTNTPRETSIPRGRRTARRLRSRRTGSSATTSSRCSPLTAPSRSI